ncbi:MAG TPA: hypothetical protein VFO34_12675 [Candidatus Acidoferrales bacterium]|nr:hypothetical protein [Candidatus Acidoferrales bacterium]
MAIAILIGIVLGLLAPACRQNAKARSAVLMAGATMVLAAAVYGLLHEDPRVGAATIAANRREYHFLMEYAFPVLALAAASLSRFKKLFWAGWSIHLAFAGFVLVVVIWLTFFWHW